MKKSTLTKLRKNLPRGARAKIAEKTGLSENFISTVLNGGLENNDVIKAALEVVAEAKKEAAELEESINLLAVDVCE